MTKVSIMSEVLAALAGAVIGGGCAVMAAKLQARGAHAQAAAARDAASRQADGAHMQWIGSNRSNACAALLADALEFEGALQGLVLRPIRMDVWPDGHPRKLRWAFRAAEYVRAKSPRAGRVVLWFRRKVRRGEHGWQSRMVRYEKLQRALTRMEHACSVIELHGPISVGAQAVRLVTICADLGTQAASWVNAPHLHGVGEEQLLAFVRARIEFTQAAQPHLT